MPRFERLTGEFEIATGARPDEVTWRFERTADVDREFTFADPAERDRPPARAMLPVMLGALRDWEGVLDAAGGPVPYSEQAFYEYVPPTLRLEVLDRWTHRMRGTEAGEAEEPSPQEPTIPQSGTAEVATDEAPSGPLPAGDRGDEASTSSGPPARGASDGAGPAEAGSVPRLRAAAAVSLDADPAVPPCWTAEGQPEQGTVLHSAGMTGEMGAVPEGPLPSESADSQGNQAPEVLPSGAGPAEAGPVKSAAAREWDAQATMTRVPVDEPAAVERPLVAPVEVGELSTVEAAASETPLPYPDQPVSDARPELNMPEAVAEASHLEDEPSAGVEVASTAQIAELPPPAEPVTDAEALEARESDLRQTPGLDQDGLGMQEERSGLGSAFDDPDLDMASRFIDAVEQVYRRIRQRELHEPLF